MQLTPHMQAEPQLPADGVVADVNPADLIQLLVAIQVTAQTKCELGWSHLQAVILLQFSQHCGCRTLKICLHISHHSDLLPT